MRWSLRVCVGCAVVAAMVLTANPIVGAQSDGPTPAPYIIDGGPIPITTAPWQVYVLDPAFFGGGSCGGSVLAPNLVLTAAHCVDQVANSFRVIVTAGSATAYDLDNGQSSRVADITIHPLYESGFLSTFEYDVALLELATPLELGPTVSPIALASAAELASAVGEEAAISGWGVIAAEDESGTDDLRGGSVIVLSDEACSASPTIGDAFQPATQVCAAATAAGTNVCRGDSGGPLVIDVAGVPKQTGIVSWGPADPPCEVSAAVFTEVPAFLGWIAANDPGPVASDARTEISGLMFDDTNGNSVRDVGEPGVADQTVTLTRFATADSFTATEVVATQQTDAQGAYRFVDVVPGIFDVTFEIPSDRVRTVANQGFDVTVDSDVAQFGAPRTQNFLARGDSAVTAIDAGVMQPTTVGGIVFEDRDLDGINDDDEPVSDAANSSSITVLHRDGSFVDLVTIRDGSFEVGLAPGTYRLEWFSVDEQLTRANVGTDDAVDSDFDPFTLETGLFELVLGENQTFDLGLRPADAEPLVILGDANCSGMVDILDAFVVAQAAVELRTAAECPLDDPANQYSMTFADATGDGVVLINDAYEIARCAVNVSDACD